MTTKTKKSKAELRIEIAKDVLKHIKAGSFRTERGTYFAVRLKKPSRGEQLKRVLPQAEKCTVCALGGLFYGHIIRHNGLEIDSPETHLHFNDLKIHKELTMFSKMQLDAIESAFERCNMSGKTPTVLIERAMNFRSKHKIDIPDPDSKTLTLIMKNIIKNKGTFKP